MQKEETPEQTSDIVDYDKVEIKMPKEDIFGNQVIKKKPKGIWFWVNILLALILLIVLLAWGLFYLDLDLSKISELLS